jgi:serine/threonine protein kinase
MNERVGQQLGNYRLTSLLGRGGFADVYLGEHIYLRTQAAIKVLSAEMATNEMEGFLTESRNLSHLVHPHIVRVLEFGIEGHIPFLVMDYAPNGTLRQLHPSGTVVPLPAVISYVKQVAEALQYAHEQKLIHRDIKPENLLIGRNHEVLLTDFGIAVIRQSTSTLRSK